MASIQARVLALRSLLEADDIPQREKEKKVWGVVLELYQELAGNLADLVEVQEDLGFYIQMIDEDLTRMEGHFYGLDDGDEEEEAPFDLTCPQCGHELHQPRAPKSVQDPLRSP